MFQCIRFARAGAQQLKMQINRREIFCKAVKHREIFVGHRKVLKQMSVSSQTLFILRSTNVLDFSVSLDIQKDVTNSNLMIFTDSKLLSRCTLFAKENLL